MDRQLNGQRKEKDEKASNEPLKITENYRLNKSSPT
jgi:hypothetical protein